MAMGTREPDQQGSFWVATTDLPTSAAHPFYEAVNRILDSRGFDRFVGELCAKFYHERMGRPSLAPAVYFRLLLMGYFEGLDSERGMAWRVSDSLGLRRYLGYSLTDPTPDHSTISRNRRLIDVETHEAVFVWMLQVLAEEGLLKGKTIGVDATTLEANAALKSIVRRDTGEGYQEFLTRLAQESGMATPTREDLARLDKQRKNKASNDDWQNPHEPDAKVAKMKDGSTHLAHKAEHAVDMDTGAIVTVTLQPADRGDPFGVAVMHYRPVGARVSNGVPEDIFGPIAHRTIRQELGSSVRRDRWLSRWRIAGAPETEESLVDPTTPQNADEIVLHVRNGLEVIHRSALSQSILMHRTGPIEAQNDVSAYLWASVGGWAR